MSRLFILVLALVVAGAACAQATGVASRERALAAIKSGSPVERAEALAWIADHGTPADAAILRQRLTDDSGLVRGFAEQGLWVLWSRSGDKAIDALMPRGVDEMRAGRHADAIATFSEVIRKKPAFAEGWNFGPVDTDAKPVQWIVEQLTAQWGQGASWQLDKNPQLHEANYLKLDCSKACSKLGWHPRWDLARTLQSIIAWHKAEKQRADMHAACLRQIAEYVSGEVV